MGGQTFTAPSGFTAKMDEKNHHLHKPVFIGEVKADAIIRGRPFKAKTELVERRLIPEALYDKINANKKHQPNQMSNQMSEQMSNQISKRMSPKAKAAKLATHIAIATFIALCARHEFALLNYKLFGDEAETIVGAKMIATGMKLYSEIFNHHGPLTFLPGLITEWLGGRDIRKSTRWPASVGRS